MWTVNYQKQKPLTTWNTVNKVCTKHKKNPARSFLENSMLNVFEPRFYELADRNETVMRNWQTVMTPVLSVWQTVMRPVLSVWQTVMRPVLSV